MRAQKKTPSKRTAFENCKYGLTFRELETGASGALTIFFTFFGARITRQETGMFEGRTEVGIVIDERASNAVKDGASLSGFTAAADVDDDVEIVGEVDELERLTQNHAKRRTVEILVDALLVDGNIAFAGTEVNARYGAFTTTCS